MVNLIKFKGGTIFADKIGNSFLILHDVRHDVISLLNGVVIPYAECDVIFQSPLEGRASSVTRLLAGDFKRLDVVTWAEAERRNAAMKVLYGRKEV